eukprot:1195161-Prorocentrum_minimum.AAC.1
MTTGIEVTKRKFENISSDDPPSGPQVPAAQRGAYTAAHPPARDPGIFFTESAPLDARNEGNESSGALDTDAVSVRAALEPEGEMAGGNVALSRHLLTRYLHRSIWRGKLLPPS